MNINLAVQFSHPSSVSNNTRYARIDNTGNPIWVNGPNVVSSPAVIANNVPNGQYRIGMIPLYPDGRSLAGRSCDETFTDTPPCPPLSSITAYLNSGNLVISYLAPSSVPKVRITVLFPNGGSSVANYVNDGNNVTVPIPASLYGDFSIQGQSVCDEASGFYSAFSSSVTVTKALPVGGTYTIGTSAATVCTGSPQTLYTNGSFAVGSVLYTDSALSIPVTGSNFVVVNNSIYNLDPTTGIIGVATGATCGASITGNTGLSVIMPNGSGNIFAPAGTLVNVSLNSTGPSGGTYTLQFFIPSMSIAEPATNGTHNFSFLMPPAGFVAWNANFSSTNSSGSGSISVS